MGYMLYIVAYLLKVREVIGDMIKELSVNRTEINTEINKPEGKYTIIYDRHDGESRYEMPDEFDGVFLESAALIRYVDPVEAEAHLNGKDGDYQKILLKAQNKGVPVYFGDLTLTDEVFIASALGITVEAFVGIKTLKTLMDLKMSRRQFIKGLGLLAGLWFLSPVIGMFASGMPKDIEQVKAIEAGMSRVNEAVHPELFKYLLTFRHMVAGYKQEWLMREMGGKPHMVSVWGLAHIGYERAIEMTLTEKKHYIERQIDLARARQVMMLESVYKIAECRFSNGKWQVEEMIDVPELKDLVV
jgi:hypothetical protein